MSDEEEGYLTTTVTPEIEKEFHRFLKQANYDELTNLDAFLRPALEWERANPPEDRYKEYKRQKELVEQSDNPREIAILVSTKPWPPTYRAHNSCSHLFTDPNELSNLDVTRTWIDIGLKHQFNEASDAFNEDFNRRFLTGDQTQYAGYISSYLSNQPNPSKSQKHLASILMTSWLGEEIRRYRETIRGQNDLSAGTRESILRGLDRLDKELELLGDIISGSNSAVEEDDGRLKNWCKSFQKSVEGEFLRYLDPNNLAKATVPTGLILGCGALGALLGGPIGFGAGSIFGNLIAGHAKPNQIAREIESKFEE